jgi:hypothetical protein
MEPFILLLLTVAVAAFAGYARRGRRVERADASTLQTTYREYLRAVSAAGLVKLSRFVGDPPAAEDVDESVKGPRLMADLVSLLERYEADAVIEGIQLHDHVTVDALLERLADDAQKYWPDESPAAIRVRRALPRGGARAQL